MRIRTKPVVGIPCDRRVIGDHTWHLVQEKYIAAVHDGAGALPLLIPVTEAPLEIAAILGTVDGLLIPGSPSNVDPAHYGGPAPRTGAHDLDPHRDATALPLIRAAVEMHVPFLAICRGHQELNVAMGGTLLQHVAETPGRHDHYPGKARGVEAEYGPAHDITLTPGGMLTDIAGAQTIRVNSVHNQGIDRLGERLVVEAVAADGLVEAVHVEGAAPFALGVQWHPEWRFAADPVSRRLFAAFGAALAHPREEAARGLL